MDCEVCELLNNDKTLVFQNNSWKVFLTSDQSYLGRCVVSCKRHCPFLSELTKDEWVDFKSVVDLLENAVKKAFACNLVNWSLLTNDAFVKKPYNPHIHWHFRPRYDTPVRMFGKTFTDPDFGEHYQNHRHEEVSEDLQLNILNAIKNAF